MDACAQNEERNMYRQPWEREDPGGQCAARAASTEQPRRTPRPDYRPGNGQANLAGRAESACDRQLDDPCDVEAANPGQHREDSHGDASRVSGTIVQNAGDQSPPTRLAERSDLPWSIRVTLGKKRASPKTAAASLVGGTHEEPKPQKDDRTGRERSRSMRRHLKRGRRREQDHKHEKQTHQR